MRRTIMIAIAMSSLAGAVAAHDALPVISAPIVVPCAESLKYWRKISVRPYPYTEEQFATAANKVIDCLIFRLHALEMKFALLTAGTREDRMVADRGAESEGRIMNEWTAVLMRNAAASLRQVGGDENISLALSIEKQLIVFGVRG